MGVLEAVVVLTGVFEGEWVAVLVNVKEGVYELVGVKVGVKVDAKVGSPVGVWVQVTVGVLVGVEVDQVPEGVGVNVPVPTGMAEQDVPKMSKIASK